MDASTTRLQLSLRLTNGDDGDLDGWQLAAGGYRVPLRTEQDERGVLRIAGLRYRSFVPWIGLHPGVGTQAPVALTLVPPAGSSGALRVTLHEWQPQARPYDGLPAHIEDADSRRQERFVVEHVPLESVSEMMEPPHEAVTEYCLDLRRCPRSA